MTKNIFTDTKYCIKNFDKLISGKKLKMINWCKFEFFIPSSVSSNGYMEGVNHNGESDYQWISPSICFYNEEDAPDRVDGVDGVDDKGFPTYPGLTSREFFEKMTGILNKDK